MFDPQRPDGPFQLLGAPGWEPPRLLLVSEQPWWSNTIESIFRPAGYTVLKRAPGSLLDDRGIAGVDAVIVHVRAADESAVELCRSLRASGAADDGTPVIVALEEPQSRQRCLDFLRAGAWECFAPPLDAETLLLKLERFVGAKRHADRLHLHSMLDPTTGLYSPHGILRRIRELADMALRYRRPLGCAVFALVPAGPRAEPDSRPSGADGREAGEVIRLLTSRGRMADVVGRLNRTEFVVLTPETDSTGVLTMATRLTAAVNSPEEEGERSRSGSRLCAGCYAVSDFAEAGIEPIEVIVRATMALRRAQSNPEGSTIEIFEPHAPQPN